jgi:hypothetical protein
MCGFTQLPKVRHGEVYDNVVITAVQPKSLFTEHHGRLLIAPKPRGETMFKQRIAWAILSGCIMVAGTAGAASATETVGSAMRVVNTVTGDNSGVKRGLNADDPIFRDERITAGGSSRGELILSDGSKIIVGENSSITLDNFALGEKGFKSGTIKVVKGAFRYISGSSPKGAIKFKTPLATIGVRGTTLDVYVGDGGVTRVVLLSGRVTTCTQGGTCITMNRSCDIVQVSGPSGISSIPFLRSKERNRTQETQDYPLTENQNQHSGGWRAFTGGCSARATLEQNLINPNGGPDRPDNVQEEAPPPPPPPPPPDEEEEEEDDDDYYEGCVANCGG